MILKLIKHFLVWIFIVWPLHIIGIPLLAVVLLFIPKNQEYLPRMLRWFDNHERYFNDHSNIDGLAGPDYYRAKRNLIATSGFFKLWYERWIWLAWRNPINYFFYAVLGAKHEDMAGYQRLVLSEPELVEIGTQPEDYAGTETVQFVIFDTDKDTIKYSPYFMWRKVIPYKNNTRCIDLRIGWKFNSEMDKDVYQWALVISPFEDFKGKIRSK